MELSPPVKDLVNSLPQKVLVENLVVSDQLKGTDDNIYPCTTGDGENGKVGFTF